MAEIASAAVCGAAAGSAAWAGRSERHAAAPRGALARAASDPSSLLRYAAGSSLRCPPAAVLRLSADADCEVAASALAHPACPTQRITTLAWDPDPEIREAVARNPSTPPGLLEECFENYDETNEAYDDARQLAVRNPSLPAAALEAWLGESWEARAAVADKPDTDPDLLVEIAACAFDADDDIPCQIALSNPSFPTDLLRTHAYGAVPDLQGAAAPREGTATPIVGTVGRLSAAQNRAAVAHNPAMPRRSAVRTQHRPLRRGASSSRCASELRR